VKKTIILCAALGVCLVLQAGCGGKYAKAPVVQETKPIATEYAIRNPANKIVTLETNYGKLVVELYRDVAPAHADSFVARTVDGFYNGTTFHRVIDGFMIQGGDPTGTGAGDAGYTLNAEFSDLVHKDGTLSMARSEDPNSASCQFFICLDRNRSTAYLDGKYTVFGQLIQGYAVLHRIGKAPVTMSPSGEQSKPLQPIVIERAYLSDAAGNPL
jgi:cyclophilin family peptidyl-prolyl cis-trans isomerase